MASIDAPTTARFEVVTPVILTGKVHEDHNLWALFPFSRGRARVAFLELSLQG